VHHLRRDYAAAMRNYRRAADLFSAVSATSGETMRVLTNLAMAQGLGGDPRGAIDTLRRILAEQETRTPHGLDVAYTYNALGLNHTRLDAWAEASTNYSRAVAIREQSGLLGIGLANTLTSRAYALIPEKKFAEARADLARALTIYDRLAPAGHARAEALHLLGVLERDAGDRRAALDLFRRAIDVLDAQQAHLGGSDEARSSYSAFYSSYYKDYAELLLQEKREPEAFETLERYRGRVLRATLAGEGRVMDGAHP
jgi:tetratricopeptide (TPR) repeat protein